MKGDGDEWTRTINGVSKSTLTYLASIPWSNISYPLVKDWLMMMVSFRRKLLFPLLLNPDSQHLGRERLVEKIGKIVVEHLLNRCFSPTKICKIMENEEEKKKIRRN